MWECSNHPSAAIWSSGKSNVEVIFRSMIQWRRILINSFYFASWNICDNLDTHLVMRILGKTLKQMSGWAAFMLQANELLTARGGFFCHTLKHHIHFIKLHSMEHDLWKEMWVPVNLWCCHCLYKLYRLPLLVVGSSICVEQFGLQGHPNISHTSHRQLTFKYE